MKEKTVSRTRCLMHCINFMRLTDCVRSSDMILTSETRRKASISLGELKCRAEEGIIIISGRRRQNGCMQKLSLGTTCK